MDTLESEHLYTIARQFALPGAVTSIAPFGRGRINDTFLVTMESGAHYVLQRVNPMFAPSVLEDIAFMTAQMKEQGFTTTELIPTKEGALGVQDGDTVWRMLTHIEGRTIEEGITGEEAQSAMALIGRFHQTFAEHTYDFQHVREGFHDTPRIMHTLAETIADYRGTPKHTALATLGDAITRAYETHPHAWAHLPKRIIHGDPKLNNIRFAAETPRAIALLDLDTMGRHSVVVDLADAARSWCNHADEGDIDRAAFDLDIFHAMMEGYTSTAHFFTDSERAATPYAIAQIALELAARFATDAYRESYFKLDREHYPNLFTQNSTKAQAQFALYRDILKKFPDLAAREQ